jgi:multiple sugar transport system substrate-binding protein
VFKAYMALLDAIDHWKVVPPVKQYAQNLDQINIPDAPGGHTPADRIPVILDSMQYAQSPQVIAKMDKYYTVLTNDIYQPILSGKTTAEAAAKQAASDLNALLH